MTDVKRPRGRPPKYPPNEVRDRLIDAAISTLLEEGVDSGLDAIGLDAAIAAAGVPRGMSYRIWQDSKRTPQDALRHGVVLNLLRLPAGQGLAATKEHLESELEVARKLLNSDDPESRRRVASELARVVGLFNHDLLDSSPEWRLYNAVRAAAVTRSNLDPEVEELLRDGEDQLIQRYASLYQWVAETLDVSIREGFTIEQFAAAAYALNEGLSGRLSTSYERRGITRTTNDGEEQDWALFSIGLEALIFHFFDV